MAETEKKPANLKGMVGAVVILASLAGILLVKYTFDGPGIRSTWPVLFIGIGIVLAVAGYYEIALVAVFVFAVILGGNLNIYSLRRAWPFTIAVIPVAVLLGYLRAKAGSGPGPESDVRK